MLSTQYSRSSHYSRSSTPTCICLAPQLLNDLTATPVAAGVGPFLGIRHATAWNAIHNGHTRPFEHIPFEHILFEHMTGTAESQARTDGVQWHPVLWHPVLWHPVLLQAASLDGLT